MALKVASLVGDPAMVDIAIGSLEPPYLRVGAKVLLHIQIDGFLQVKTTWAEGSHDDIAADATLRSDISPGVADAHVAGVIAQGDAHLPAGISDKVSHRGHECEKKDNEFWEHLVKLAHRAAGVKLGVLFLLLFKCFFTKF